MIGAAGLAQSDSDALAARVLASHVRDGRARLRVRATTGGEAFEATALRLSGPAPVPGDEVLVLRAATGEAWIVGVVAGAAGEARQLAEPGGATTEIVADTTGVRLRVRDRSGELLFEHDPAAGRSRVLLPAGDLDLEVADGDLSLAAARRLRLGAEAVEIRARRQVSAEVEPGGAGATRLDLGRDGMRLAAGRLSLAARETHLLSGLARVSADSLQVGARCASAAFTTVEIAADRVRQRVRQSYQHVRELMHVRAGRAWTEVAGALRLRGGTASLRARGRVKVDGESVHLG